MNKNWLLFSIFIFLFHSSLFSQKAIQTTKEKPVSNTENELKLEEPVQPMEILDDSESKKIVEKRTYSGILKVNKDYDSSRKSLDSYMGKEIYLIVSSPASEKGVHLTLQGTKKYSSEKLKKMNNKKVSLEGTFYSVPPNPLEQAPVMYTPNGKTETIPRTYLEVNSLKLMK